MALKRVKKKKVKRRSSSGGVTGSNERPRQIEKLPPCAAECPSGIDIRGWLTTIAQRDLVGAAQDESLDKAWHMVVETGPFPAIMGRVCPHPCETACNRKEKDNAVGINACERFIGDWGIERGLELTKLEGVGPFDEKIAVIGAGPGGLSCAYQLARRGYKVTVFESFDKAGGMLRWGIPVYRLPREVIDAEVQRILDLGVELRLNTTVGRDVSFADLREEYAAIFIAIGAHTGKLLGIPGEDVPGVWTGTDFLREINAGEQVDVGQKVVVIGGGDTAIDAARVSARLGTDAATVSAQLGAEVTILYRRTRKEMPAIEREIEEALEENIALEYLAAPAKVVLNGNGRKTLVVQRMKLGDLDRSGRRRPIPIEGDVYEVEFDTLIAAVSQKPALEALGVEIKGSVGSWLNGDEWGKTEEEGIWTGGDNINLGIATTAVGQGRKAAESIHATLRDIALPEPDRRPPIGTDRIKFDYYTAMELAERYILPPEERLAKPYEEIDKGITEKQFLSEVKRCLSCGACFGCENCWMYCQTNAFYKVENPRIGYYFDVKLELCEGCRKCADECPCGYLDMV